MIWPRLLIALPLLAAPIWAGAASRSYWMAPLLIAVFVLAYIDGKNRLWRIAFAESSALEMAKTVFGAALAQTVLVSLLFFAASGVAAAFDILTDRAPIGRLDFIVAASVLAISLLGGALVRWAEGDRDPVDRALESLQTTLREIEEDELSDEDEADDDPFVGLETELDAMAERFLVGEAELESLTRRFLDASAPLSVASHLTHLARNPDPDADERVGAPNRLRVVYRAMRGLWEAQSEEIEDIYAASFEALIFSTLNGGDAALRMEALSLAEAMALSGDRLSASLKAIEKEPGLDDESGQALKRRASSLLARLEAL